MRTLLLHSAIAFALTGMAMATGPALAADAVINSRTVTNGPGNIGGNTGLGASPVDNATYPDTQIRHTTSGSIQAPVTGGSEVNTNVSTDVDGRIVSGDVHENDRRALDSTLGGVKNTVGGAATVGVGVGAK